jgi:hypothetical protein
MAVSRVKTSSILQGFPKSRSLLAGNAGYDPAAMFLIQRVAGTGSSTTVTFSSIPSTYKHLQIRATMRSTNTGTSTQNGGFYFNGDNAANYAQHQLFGQVNTFGSATVGVYGDASSAGFGAPYVVNGVPQNSLTAGINSAWIIDIHDYASTTKNKTARVFQGIDSNGESRGLVNLFSTVWLNTAAITSITLETATGLTTGSTFALYGMVG